MASMLSGKRLDVREVAHLLKRAATITNADAMGEEALRAAIGLVCSFTGWPLGHVFLLDPARVALVSTGIWHNDDPARFAPFIDATRQTLIPRGVGLPGRVLASGAPAWIADVRRDANFPRGASALACGIGAGFAIPIASKLGVEGVLEFFAVEPLEPDEWLLDLLSHIGRELAHAFERSRTLAALAAGEARLAEAERLGRMGSWSYHVQDDRLEWSAELRTIYGLEATAPATLEQFLAHVHPDDRELVSDDIRRAVATRGVFEHEYQLIVSPDDIRWAHSRGEVVAGGGPVRMTGYCQDVTDRKRREEAIRITQERLAEAQRLAHLGSWSWDIAPNAIAWSDEMFRIHGLEPGMPPARMELYMDFIHAEDRPWMAEEVVRAVTSGDPVDIDYRIVRPTGEVRWIHGRSVTTAWRDGRPARMVGYCHDVTEQRLAEEERERLEGQLRQAQRLESLGQLAGGVAHDFNNLLAVILNYTGFVDEELAAFASASGDPGLLAARADVEQIGRAARRAAELTRQLLSFSRREVMRPRVLDLNQIVGDVEQLLRRTLGEHVVLHTALAPDVWHVSADPGQLEQVLVNLAVNARDAMPNGGRLIIETANVHVDAVAAARFRGLRAGRHVRLRVSDTGQGMTKEVLERAFEPFFTTKPKGEGTGLGLSTVFGIIVQAGGTAHIASQPGRGTTVTAFLPATEAALGGGELDSPSSRPSRAGGETVLVVENEEAIREVTRRMLVRNGYRVFTAASGTEAIEIARQHGAAIRLLLTDVIMPQMLGNEVAAAIAELIPGIAVLYMSGYAQPLLASQGRLDPSVVLIEKPFSEDELLDKVGELIERSGAEADADRESPNG
jgi:PAS domain S-box-containing protein